jgi:hypothetical protein
MDIVLRSNCVSVIFRLYPAVMILLAVSLSGSVDMALGMRYRGK